jgi:hypothetical protein
MNHPRDRGAHPAVHLAREEPVGITIETVIALENCELPVICAHDLIE